MLSNNCKKWIVIVSTITIGIAGIIGFAISYDFYDKHHNSQVYKTVYKVIVNSTLPGSRLPDYTRYSYNLCDDSEETAFIKNEHNLSCDAFMDFLGFAYPVIPQYNEPYLNCTLSETDTVEGVEIPPGASMIRNFPLSPIEYNYLDYKNIITCTRLYSMLSLSYNPNIYNANLELLRYYEYPELEKPTENFPIIIYPIIVFSPILTFFMLIIGLYTWIHRPFSSYKTDSSINL